MPNDTRRSLRRRAMLLALLTATCAPVALQNAAAAAQDAVLTARPFKIQAGPLAASLKRLAAESGMQIVFTEADVAALQAPSLEGSFTAREALSRLLAGSGLGTEQVGANAFIVRKGGGLPNPKRAGGELPPAYQPAQGQVPTEEIIVTAGKRAERLQDVPSSVTAVNTNTLVEQGQVKLEEYAARIPGLSVTNTSAGGATNQISIRGITTGGGGNPTVGINIDDAPFGASTVAGGGNSIPDFDPADLDRIEVLRGPQGTLYGGGSLGGLIKFVTKAPDPSAFSGRVQLDGSSVAKGDLGYGIRAGANIPVTDTFAVRVSGFQREDGGFIDDPQRRKSDVNRSHYDGGRVALGLRPNDWLDLRLTATVQHIRADGNANIDVDATTFRRLLPDLQAVRAPGSDYSSALHAVYAFRIGADLGFADLVSSTSYGRDRFTSAFDYTAELAPVLAGIFGVPNAGAAVRSDLGGNKFTQEIRLSSPVTQTLAWQFGGFYTNERGSVVQSISTFNAITGGPLSPPLPSLLTASVPSRFEELAVFGDVTWRIRPGFDITGGLRYSHNNQRNVTDQSGLLVGPPSSVFLASKDSSVTFLVNPRWRINEQVMVYARVASGYRPGGANIPGPGNPATYDPDTVVNYEMGVKADLMERTLSFDAAAFFIDWKKVQLRLVNPATGLNYYGNAAAAHSQGIEGSLTWRPVRGLTIAGNIAWTEAELDRNTASPSYGLKGDPLPMTAKWASYVSADYEFPVTGGWNGSVGADWRHLGERIGNFESTAADRRFVLPAFDTIDLRAGLSQEQWSLTAFVRNLTDKRAYMGAFRFGPIQQVAVNQPRTIGVTTSFRF